jgi:ferredoxin, 2Fe-2S
MAKIHVVTRNGSSISVDGSVGRSVMETLRDHGLDVEAICGGACSCATCHVFISDAWIDKTAPCGEDEAELLQASASYHDKNSRLSCQIKFTEALDGLALTVAPAE